ncbi:pyridoxamine 5'-phosphate oxidase family protein [Pseudomonas haemolytica]|uniref:Flavin-nucleotide-binding protein n=1 Tax=Pseudomonas haemolytica TaxID=2600065 RepID=A0A5P1DBT2_9PSED|nr:pyridoxamine 5'-phosphate oxidase family protein [Pseudomonas haemolytica]MBJ2245112.1 pyridoxamine 5'-phosphate oxidase family protein [Pseudomonas haemolytica]MBJ2272448.1 pyridoxamine 5'-phosphate oxidase family protein [Pseudomonas haemolytica]MBK3446785.1 pyridoxamine 5'-phosphate oxidase family protein [Pseudomonas haemolytica]MBK3458280.1 pyridoxamine 5'-phosphate oxidase family protein [Pseudomonas haemolytica]MRJ36918.1 flavin-nucleotide-binding protein [Pseudomonas haemolytica]
MNSIEQSPWHVGERHLQESAGVAERMAMIGPKVIRDHLPEQHRDFYPLLPYLILGVVDEQGIPWATMLEGAPGFAHSPDPQALQIDSLPSKSDPASAGVTRGASVGLLGIDLNTRRRNRMNGRIGSLDHDGFAVDVVHTFGNCPKYIQLRPVAGVARKPGDTAECSTSLDAAAQTLIRNADTFFVASYVDQHGERSVDVSHRGGNTGFVRVEGNVLTIPDFAGNLFFNTLGNLRANPIAGLLFVDFETGDVLQVAGRTSLILSGPPVAEFEGAQRLWTVTVEHVVRRPAALALRWQLAEFSPYSLAMGTW